MLVGGGFFILGAPILYFEHWYKMDFPLIFAPIR
jgi:hypothetical protein